MRGAVVAAGGRLVLEVAEGGRHVFQELVEVCLDLSLAFFHGVLELHGGELVEYVAHGVTDDVPGDLVVGLRGGLDGVSGHVVECDDVLQHAHGLVERTETIV